MTNPEAVRRIQEFEAQQRQMQEMREKVVQDALGRRAGECIGDCKGNMANLDCKGLAKEKAATIEAQKKSQLAAESYKKNHAERVPPSGYSNATDADLDALGLRDPATGATLLQIDKDSNFNSAVFKNDATGNYTIGFKGTDAFSGEDWDNNLGQSDGKLTPYYSQAVTIARRANDKQPGRVSFVGHSLGGGLASAAARATGRPATTFNAAGLHPNTVPTTVGNPPIDAWYVKGEVLNRAQSAAKGWKPEAAGRRIPLNADPSIEDLSPVGGPVTRHLNYRIQAAFKRRLDAIEKLQREKNCPI